MFRKIIVFASYLVIQDCRRNFSFILIQVLFTEQTAAFPQ